MKRRRYYIENDSQSLSQTIKNTLLGKKIKNFPESIVIETITGCNAKCIFCSQHEARKGLPNGTISDELFLKIAEECSKNENVLKRFSFAFDNEPLLDKNLAWKVKHIKKVCPTVTTNITTNGILLTPERVKELFEIEALDEFNISVQGIQKETYEKLMGVKTFDRVMENLNFLSTFSKTYKGKKISIEINTCLTSETISQKSQIEQFCEDKGFKPNFVVLDSRAEHVNSFVNTNSPKQYYKYCKRPFHTMVICWNGIVPLCCADYSQNCILGDLSKNSIKAVWKGNRATQARREMITGQFDIAKMCKYCELS